MNIRRFITRIAAATVLATVSAPGSVALAQTPEKAAADFFNNTVTEERSSLLPSDKAREKALADAKRLVANIGSVGFAPQSITRSNNRTLKGYNLEGIAFLPNREYGYSVKFLFDNETCWANIGGFQYRLFYKVANGSVVIYDRWNRAAYQIPFPFPKKTFKAKIFQGAQPVSTNCTLRLYNVDIPQRYCSVSDEELFKRITGQKFMGAACSSAYSWISLGFNETRPYFFVYADFRSDGTLTIAAPFPNRAYLGNVRYKIVRDQIIITLGDGTEQRIGNVDNNGSTISLSFDDYDGYLYRIVSTTASTPAKKKATPAKKTATKRKPAAAKRQTTPTRKRR